MRALSSNACLHGSVALPGLGWAGLGAYVCVPPGDHEPHRTAPELADRLPRTCLGIWRIRVAKRGGREGGRGLDCTYVSLRLGYQCRFRCLCST